MVVVRDDTNKYYPDRTKRIGGVRLLKVGIPKEGEPDALVYGSTHRLLHEPTGNCQMSILSNAMGFLYPGTRNYTKEDRVSIFSQIREMCDTNALLVDIPIECLDTLKEVLEVEDCEIIFESPYTNLTGTEMVIVYIKLENYFSGDDEDDEDDEYWEDDDF